MVEDGEVERSTIVEENNESTQLNNSSSLFLLSHVVKGR